MSPFLGLNAIEVLDKLLASIIEELPLLPLYDIPIILSIWSWGTTAFTSVGLPIFFYTYDF
jgi:hypothetical protein